jgi:hypothetical protein
MSAVIKEKHIETIFDYDLTDEEREVLTFGLSEKDYLEISSSDNIYLGLASLFDMRGDYKKGAFYLNKVNQDFVKTNIKYDFLIR